MSLTTKAIGAAKKIKRRFDAQIKARTPVYLSPTRRIERVALKERVAAMTFDDGPCRTPANPSAPGDATPLTVRIAETLEKYGARGTFDVVGDTSGNYPDKAGKEGSAEWGGIKFDHYPDFGKDADGGAVNCPELIERLLKGNHEITSHTYAHVLFGPKRPVYGGRDPLGGVDPVIEDLARLDSYMKESFGYNIKLSRPPHYVDKMKDGFTSYDAYALMGYQYMAASFDGAGWLPLSDYESEVEAMYMPIRKELSTNADFFCGQIIFQKDGYNMARRSPVADGLERQLELLYSRGYRIVTASELLEMCPFADLSPDEELFEYAKRLLGAGYCVCYKDNTTRKDSTLTRGELAMMTRGASTVRERIEIVRKRISPTSDVRYDDPYAAAIKASIEAGELSLSGGRFFPKTEVTPKEFGDFCEVRFGKAPTISQERLTHGTAIKAMAELI